MTERGSRPPRVAEWILRAVTRPDDRDFILGDIGELFDDVVRKRGVTAARRSYWAEVARSLPALATRRIQAAFDAAHETNQLARSGGPMWESVTQDASYAWRLTRRAPHAAITIVATMVVGIGATTAVFSTANALLLRPLPFPASDRVVELQGVLRNGQAIDNLAYPDLVDFRRGVPDFAALTIVSENTATLQRENGPRLLHTVQVDSSYAGVFGTRLILGRGFTADERRPNGPRVLILSHAFWMTAFNGDRNVLGRVLTVDDEPTRVVGVLAHDAYTYPRPDADALEPLVIQPNTMYDRRGAMWAGAAARLAPSASIGEADRDVSSIADRIAREFAPSNEGIGARIRPLHEAVIGGVRPMLELLAAVVAAVLVIACINVANLVLARARGRVREFALRSALGGTPARVQQQIFVEGLLLATFGGIGGIALAPWLTRAFVELYPDVLPRANEIGIDLPVVLIAIAATMLAGGLSAFPAARRARRMNLAADLRDGARGGSSRGERRFGAILIVSQVAASLAVLFGAGLLLQTFRGLTLVDPGFQPHERLTFQLVATPARYRTPADIERYFANATAALRAIPGVDAAESTTLLPFGGGYRYDVFINDLVGDQGTNNPAGAVAIVSPGLPRDLGLRLVRGREFATSDDDRSRDVVMINEALARRMFGSADPVGKLIGWSGRPDPKLPGHSIPRDWTIVGVVHTARMISLSEDPMPMLYVPVAQAVRSSRYVVLRSTRPTAEVLAAARAALRAVDPTIAMGDVATMDDRIARSLAEQRFRAMLMTTLGALALVLSLIGIHAVVANAVVRRTREIGMRIALGKTAVGVATGVVLDALRVAGVGVAIGLGLALVTGRWLAAFLVGVGVYDPVTLAAAAAGMLAIVAVAAAMPARRAALVDPIVALKAE